MGLGFENSRDSQRYFAIKEQSVRDVAETGAGATLLPLETSPGFTIDGTEIAPVNVQRDLQTLLADDGQQTASLQITSGHQPGAYDLPIHNVLRAATATAAAVKSESDFGAITGVSGNTVTFASDPLAANVREGDVHTPLTGFDAADVDEHFVVTGVTTSTITYHKAPATSGAVATYTLTQQQVAFVGENDCMFTGEERFDDANFSHVVEGMRFSAFTSTSAFNGMCRLQATARGRILNPISGAANFSAPVAPTSLEASDALRTAIIGGTSGTKLSAHTLNATRANFTGQESGTTPTDIGVGGLLVDGSVTRSKDGIVYTNQYLTRTIGFSVGILIERAKPEGGPNAFDLFYMSNCKWRAPGQSAANSGDFTTETLNFSAGKDLRGGARRAVMMVHSSLQ